MPMLTTLRMRLPVWPFQSPLRTRLAKARHLVEHGVHVGHDVLAVDHDDLRPSGARSATCSTARFSETLILSPRNIASMRSRSPDSLGELEQQTQRLVGDAVLRVVEEDAGGLDGQALAAFRVVGEELRRAAAGERCLMRGERLPGRSATLTGRASSVLLRAMGWLSRCLARARFAVSGRFGPQPEAARKGVGVSSQPAYRRQFLHTSLALPPPSTTSSGSSAAMRRAMTSSTCLRHSFLPKSLQRRVADVVLERRLPIRQVRELHRHAECRRRSSPCRVRCQSPRNSILPPW